MRLPRSCGQQGRHEKECRENRHETISSGTGGLVLWERTTLMAALKPQKLADSRFEAYPYLITSTYDRSRSAPPDTRMTLVSLASAE